MKRHIIVLLALLVAATAWGGAYPDEYYGPPLPAQGECIEIEAYTPTGWYHDMNPWSMPSPEEGVIWFGTLCVEGPVAVLEFTQLAGRYCNEAPWGTPGDPPLCWAWMWLDINEPDRHIMAWDPAFDSDWGFYQASVSAGDWIWIYDSITDLGDGTAMFVEGAWHFIPPLWFEESDEFTRWKFLVSPKVTPVFGLVRTAGMRRSPS
jgi:hypothetical protein